MKRLRVFLLPLDGMLVHRRSLSRNLLGFPNNSPVPIYTPGWRGTVRVECLAQEHNSVPGQNSNPDRSFRERAHWPLGHCASHGVGCTRKSSEIQRKLWNLIWKFSWDRKDLNDVRLSRILFSEHVLDFIWTLANLTAKSLFTCDWQKWIWQGSSAKASNQREHTILLNRKRVNKGMKAMNSLPLSFQLVSRYLFSWATL